MKVGFSILSHKQPDYIFNELVKRLLEYPDHYIAIHHDYSKAIFDLSLHDLPGIHLIQDHEQTAWSHVNNISALLKTFEILYQQQCDWFITLSANCYPVKETAHILHFLNTSTYDGYIECNNINTDHFGIYKYFRKAFRTEYVFRFPFFRKNGKPYLKVVRKKRPSFKIPFNEDLQPYHGSDWFMINRKCMAYILSNKDRINTLVTFLKDVNKGPDLNVCPPEVVFQTILANNKSLHLNNNIYRYIDWTDTVDWHPHTLALKDLQKIKESEALFARKFDSAHSTELINEINRSILSKQY